MWYFPFYSVLLPVDNDTVVNVQAVDYSRIRIIIMQGLKRIAC